MDGIRHHVEASLSRTRDVIMEDHYRRLHFEPSVVAPHYWAQPAPTKAGGRFKRHLPAIPKKKSKDGTKKPEHFEVPAYPKHYKDKYGSVSAHSTSAIYGALRAPHCHAMYGPSDVWYASVRSLNSRPRDVVYPTEAYEWREPIYEDVTREMCAIPPQVELVPRPACVCMLRMRLPHESSSSHPKSSRHQPRCKHCTNGFAPNGLSNGVPSSSKRTLPTSEKIKSSSTEEKGESKPESTGRMSSYKKGIPCSSSKYKSAGFTKVVSSKDKSSISRKSILECDVTAYDLIKKVVKTPTVSEIEDSDVDDDLSDNAVSKINRSRLIKLHNKTKSKNSSPCGSLISNKKSSPKFRNYPSENSIYNESPSVLVGGQRIFTENNLSKSPDLSNIEHHENNIMVNRQSCSANWERMSVSVESVCIPDPDYDFSDDSDDGTVISSKHRDPKFTYSPPSYRKSLLAPSNGLLYTSREICKSMSSLQSEDTLIPSINASNSYMSSPMLETKTSTERFDCDTLSDYKDLQENTESEASNIISESFDDSSPVSSRESRILRQDTKYESSSDCSSCGGTLSSDYPTWTSSSSNELKSILKKKRKRENAIQELGDATRVFRSVDQKEAQKKKQVQFRPSSKINRIAGNTSNDSPKDGDREISGSDSDDRCQVAKNSSVIPCDTCENLSETASDKYAVKELCLHQVFEDSFTSTKGDSHVSDIPNEAEREWATSPSGSKKFQQATVNEHPANRRLDDLVSSPVIPSIEPPPKKDPTSSLVNGLSSSLEDVREGIPEKVFKDKRRRRRTTLPKRRFSDLHLHLLLCPTGSSICGDGSSSDDVPLTAAAQRAHRSLPESPSELDQDPSFCFDFLEKTSKSKIRSLSRSVFYVSVEGKTQLGQTKAQLTNEESASFEKDQPQNANANVDDSVVSPSIDDDQKHSQTVHERLAVTNAEHEENISPEQYDTDEDNLENEYENLDPIYEELSDVSNSSKRLSTLKSNEKSFFEGASKIDILSYLEDAKERGISEGLSEDEKVILEEEDEKVCSGEEDLIEKNRVITNNSHNHKEILVTVEEDPELIRPEKATPETPKSPRISEVERNDSGVGTETSKPHKLLPADNEEQFCADCDHHVEPVEDEESGLLFSPLVCHKCELRRCERKEIIIEFVDTELKYGRDLRIIKEEFYRPMEIAGLLIKEQLQSIFLNLDELSTANLKFSEKLQDALDIAMEHGDEDYTTVNIGKIFFETSSMLHAFETYCVKQASASVLLNNLEKEKELLRIFLRVSQMENTLLRRMNLPAFLMVPVQRVTRYPLLLSRLHKVTPIHHKDRNALKEAQQKVELHLEHINQQTKGVGGTKIWRRISNISASHRRFGNLQDIGNIKLRKMALEVLKWKQDEVRFVIAGKLLFTQVTDYPWNKKGKTTKFTPLHALLIALGKPNSNYRPDTLAADNAVLFPRNTGIRDASLVLMKEKSGRFITIRDPLFLKNCVISTDSDAEDVFEIQEYTTKEAYLLKGESKKETKEWLRQLRYHAKDLGTWRKRRNALANIMINGMIRQ